jgi:hypothetical protein
MTLQQTLLHGNDRIAGNRPEIRNFYLSLVTLPSLAQVVPAHHNIGHDAFQRRISYLSNDFRDLSGPSLIETGEQELNDLPDLRISDIGNRDVGKNKLQHLCWMLQQQLQNILFRRGSSFPLW